MKSKISITLEIETVEKINSEIASGRFRNKSHAVEYAVKKLLGEENGGA